MKKVWLGILATLLLALFVAPAFAWEFSMTGEFEWRQQYFSRVGNRDIFGDANAQDNVTLNSGYAYVPNVVTNGVDRADIGLGVVTNGNRQAWVGFAGPNIYGTGWMNPALVVQTATAAGTSAGRPIIADNATAAGVQITRGGFSRWGCDAYLGDQRLTFVPSIRVNNAIRVHGTYTVGGLRQKYAQRTYDAYGNVSPGTPPFERYYMHHSSEAAYNTAAIGSWEQVRATVQLPIGTLSYGIKDFPFGSGMQYANNTRTDSFLLVVPYGPFRWLFGIWPGQGGGVGNTSFDTVPDKDTKWDYRYGPGMTYENGPFWFGAFGIETAKHAHPRYATIQGLANGAGGADYTARFWEVAAKYNNGRFFANVDYVNNNGDITRNGQVLGVTAGYSTNYYIENNKFLVELGALCGPAKLTFMTAWASGNVANYGAVTHGNHTKGALNIIDINYQVLQPYSFLMFPTYGGGNNRFNEDGTGQMGDAYCLAARFDYAAAANLNLFGSYIWASRVEQNGVVAGTYNASSNTVGTGAAWKTANGFGPNPNPFVDDSYIGWEGQLGLDWKLLEGMSANLAYSYWQLGPWFDQAYQVFSGSPNGLNGNGLMVGRDPIQSIRGALVINF